MRTWPASTSAAALVRAFTTRACHSHLSRRWRSKQITAVEDRTLGPSAILALAVSCSLSAASLANGELGSIGRSRSRGGALVANWPVRRPALGRLPRLVARLRRARPCSRPPPNLPLSSRSLRCLVLALSKRSRGGRPCPRAFRSRARRAVPPRGNRLRRRIGRAGLRKSLWRSRRPRPCRSRLAPSPARSPPARWRPARTPARPADDPDGDGGGDHDAAGDRPIGRRAARLRPFPALAASIGRSRRQARPRYPRLPQSPMAAVSMAASAGSLGFRRRLRCLNFSEATSTEAGWSAPVTGENAISGSSAADGGDTGFLGDRRNIARRGGDIAAFSGRHRLCGRHLCGAASLRRPARPA